MRAMQITNKLVDYQKERLPDYRLTILLESDPDIYLPHNYREHVQGWIYSKCLHNTEMGKKMRASAYPCYTFALVPQHAYKSHKGVRSRVGYWILHVGSAYRQMLELIEGWVNSTSAISWANIQFKSRGVYHHPVREQSQYAVQPISILSKNGKFLAPMDGPEFTEVVQRGLARRYISRTGEEPGEIKFGFIGAPRKRLIQYKRRDLLAFEGDIRLNASLQVIRFAQLVGLGQKPGAGLGMLL